MKYSRGFTVKILPPTNHRGTRLKIRDLKTNKSIVTHYQYQYNSIEEQAVAYLKRIGIKINSALWDSKNDTCILITNDFKTQLIKERG